MSVDPQKFAGRVAIVTGGGQGIGAACARRLSVEGADVIIADLDGAHGESVAAALRAAGHSAICVPTDVSQADEVRALVAVARERFGQLNILLNNAGIHETRFTDQAHSYDLDEDIWQRVLDVNLRGTWLCSKYATPLLAASGGGVIINAASIGGIVGYPMGSAYGPSKAGVIQLTRVMAVDLAPLGIRVVGYAPGTTDTEMVSTWLASPSAIDLLAPRLVPRLTRPDEVAAFISYLASDDAATFIGTCLVMDAGATAWRGVGAVHPRVIQESAEHGAE